MSDVGGEPILGPAPGPIGTTRIGRTVFVWGVRTYVMGILNVTPDSFSGDGILRPSARLSAADRASPAPAGGRGPSGQERLDAIATKARQMVAEGADLLDVGGESTRPGHVPVEEREELARVVPAVRAIRAALPEIPISVDTTKPAVAAAALDAGADCINNVWGVGPLEALPRLAAERAIPYVLMHNREEARYSDVVAEVVADLERAIERTVALGVPRSSIIVDPGIGFGKTVQHNLVLLRGLAALRVLGRPILLGTSRKSTLGHVLGGVPPAQRLEGTLATTALGIAAGVDMVRVHDVGQNVRVARVCDAILRGREEDAG
ncbi:MAG: dihydropteroate synthase [Candidatus Limnocylindrales bacterium]